MTESVHKAQVIARFGQTCRIYDEQAGILDCHIKRNITPPVTGDRVHWQADPNVICEVLARETVLERKDKTGRCKPLAANIDQIFIVSAFAEPGMKEAVIDGYLVIAENEGIFPVLLLNKEDLADKDETLWQRMRPYQTLGYPVIACSTYSDTHQTALNTCMAGHTSILVGQSGVGKSSIINGLIPQANIATLPLSSGIQQGQHTTTASTLYTLEGGGKLIDSPGIRRFTPFINDRNYLDRGFKEIYEFSVRCQFSNCTHIKEKNCAVKQAIEEGEISEIRFRNYLHLIEEIEPT